MTNEEQLQQLKELAEQWNKEKAQPHQSVCPNCGYCPHCGRGRQLQPLYQNYPTYPWYPTGPTWIAQPSVIWCNTGGMTQGTSGHFLTGMSVVSNT